ncbi:glycine zipper 2TM domain-containing protein [Sinimarinibacterium sp. CAU 1509]|uniref:glycine zipper 2TM domain-containing protein n=1 Tax=Sinimarinibacterium sp. CAU 1509 TaxID=2562283 RepID=UPI00146CE8CD|nr:glycine zipper 2TM domain-containing protein [Sinimarinibacterium sp. CAU 1509]
MKKIKLMMVATAIACLGGCAGYPASTSNSQSGPYVVNQQPAYRSNTCADCGTVNSVTAREVAGQPNIAGAVIGAIIGGVAGNQFGKGRGNTAATAGGAVVGGVVGSQVSKTDSSTVYDIVIRMDNGTLQTQTVAATGGLRSGSRVRVSGDQITPM